MFSIPMPTKSLNQRLERLHLVKQKIFTKKNRFPILSFRFTKSNSLTMRPDLNAQVESRDESSEYWIRENITFDAAYGDERIIAHLFLPKNAAPPYQTVIYFPGEAAQISRIE